MEEPSPDDLASLALTERELFSLYVQYPDINFDPESTHKNPEPMEQFSSPGSQSAEPDDIDSVQMSNSTRHTTPLKHDLFCAGTSSDNEYAAFCSQLRHCDLPSQTVQYFKSMGSRIVQIGRRLTTEEGIQASAVIETTKTLLPQLQHSSNKIREQIDTIAYITELAPFSIIPTDVSLWSNYRQRASLITKHLSLPSQTELSLLDALFHLFDAYIYNSYLNLTTSSPILSTCEISSPITSLYDALLILLSTYQRWHRNMSSFKATHMTPIMCRIQDSPWIQREIEQMEATYEAAKNVLCSTNEAQVRPPGVLFQQEQVIAAAKAGERRARSSASKVVSRVNVMVKSRFKREHTI